MAKVSQAQTKKLVNAFMSAYAEFNAVFAQQQGAIIKGAEVVAALVQSHAIASDIKPKALGKIFFGDEYAGNSAEPNPQFNYIRAVCARLRKSGVLVAPERKKRNAVELPSLEQWQALANMAGTEAAAHYTDAVLLDLTEKEISAIITMLQACVS